MLFLHNTSRIEGEKYDKLLSEKGFRGFPSLAFMDAEGEVLTSSMARKVTSFEQTAAALAQVAELSKADKEGKLEGDAAAKFILASIDLGKMDLAEATRRRGAIKGPLSAASTGDLDAKMTDLEVTSIIAKHQEEAAPKRNELMQSLRPAAGGEPPSVEERQEVTTKLTEIANQVNENIAADLERMIEAKRLPSDKHAYSFWQYVYRSATQRKDAHAIERAKKELTALATRAPEHKAMIERLLNPPAAGAVRPATPIRPAPAAGGDKKKGADK